MVGRGGGHASSGSSPATVPLHSIRVSSKGPAPAPARAHSSAIDRGHRLGARAEALGLLERRRGDLIPVRACGGAAAECSTAGVHIEITRGYGISKQQKYKGKLHSTRETAEACASRRWWAATYGSVVESPLVQFSPKGWEQRCGGNTPLSKPPIVSMLGSLTVTQCFTLSPKFSKQASAYAVRQRWWPKGCTHMNLGLSSPLYSF